MTVLPIAGRWQVRIETLINDFEKIAIEDADRHALRLVPRYGA
jgi:hypothetical protein